MRLRLLAERAVAGPVLALAPLAARLLKRGEALRAVPALDLRALQVIQGAVAAAGLADHAGCVYFSYPVPIPGKGSGSGGPMMPSARSASSVS